MVAQKRVRGPYSHDEGQDGWEPSIFMPLSLADIQDVVYKSARAGLRTGLLAVFMVLLLHADALGRVSGSAIRIAEETNLRPDTVRHILGKLVARGELEVERPGAGRRRPLWRIARLRIWP